MSDLKRTVLVTGASSGIGRAIARRLLKQGHRVIAVSRDPSQFQTTHPALQVKKLDLADLAAIEHFVRQLRSEQPDLDAVVFAAGYGRFGGLEQFSAAQIQHLLQINLLAPMYLTRLLLPALKRQSSANIIYIGSEAALKGSRNGSVYCASKFGLRGFSQALRDECGKTSVRVSLINPGMVDTAFFDHLNFAPGKQPGHALQADDIADAVSYIFQAARHCMIDEINLSPVSKVIEFKK